MNAARMRAQEIIDEHYAFNQITREEWSRKFDALSNPECKDHYAVVSSIEFVSPISPESSDTRKLSET